MQMTTDYILKESHFQKNYVTPNQNSSLMGDWTTYLTLTKFKPY